MNQEDTLDRPLLNFRNRNMTCVESKPIRFQSLLELFVCNVLNVM